MAEDALRLTPASRPRRFAPCAGCGTQLAPTLLACPACGALAHTAELTSLAAAAEGAEARGDLSASAAAWRRALELLPASAPQHAVVAARLDEASRRLDGASAD